MKQDAETKKILDEQKEIKNFTETAEWPLLRSKFLKKITDLIDLSTLDLNALGDSDRKIAVQVLARRMSADILYDFITTDIEGAARVANGYTFTLNKENYIVRE